MLCMITADHCCTTWQIDHADRYQPCAILVKNKHQPLRLTSCQAKSCLKQSKHIKIITFYCLWCGWGNPTYYNLVISSNKSDNSWTQESSSERFLVRNMRTIIKLNPGLRFMCFLVWQLHKFLIMFYDTHFIIIFLYDFITCHAKLIALEVPNVEQILLTP